MSCEPKFEAEVPIQCAIDVVRALRNGDVGNGKVAKQALWLAGCTIESLGMTDPPAVLPATFEAGGETHVLDTAEQMAEFVDAHYLSSSDAVLEVEAIPPEVWAIIIQIAVELLNRWLNRG